MKHCTYCGAELPDNARACSNCGRPVPDMQNTELGAERSREENVEAGVNTAAEETVSGPAEDAWNTPAGQEGWTPQQQTPQGTQNSPDQQGSWSPQGQQNPQGPWGTQNAPGQQGGWSQQGQQSPQGPWGTQNMPGQQDPWNPQGQQSPQQGPWGWQQNYGGPYNGYGMPQNAGAHYNNFALWSLVFGFLASFLNGFIFIPSILAIVFAVVGLVQISRNPGMFRGRWMAVVGLAFGIFFLIVYGYVFHIVFQAVQNPETFQQLQQYLQEINAGGR